jgi:nucleoside-diphosphate-sugar epimerase
VTGGTGLLGRGLVKGLVAGGYSVKVLARERSNVERLKRLGVEIVYGDIADKVSFAQSFEGVDVVVHAAAGTSGSRTEAESGTVQGTRNVLELCVACGVRKLVYMSSCSVYGVVDYLRDALVTEDFPLERFPEKRGHYSSSKQAAEALVQAAMGKGDFRIVILRPGTIYAPDGELFPPMLGFALGKKLFLVIGNGSFELPLVWRDNLVDAIIQSIRNEAADDQIFNVVDGEPVSKRRYMGSLIKKLYPKTVVLYIPYGLLYAATWVQELLCRLWGRGPFLTRYRLTSSQKQIRYDNSKIVRMLAWKPRVTFEDSVSIIEKERHETVHP